MGQPDDKPRFFRSRAEFRAWLAKHHASAPVLWVGFWKAHTGKGGLTYDEAVDESLCHGWIDGIVKRVDEDSYKQRFTPRRKGSTWSAINLKKVENLKAAGLMAPAGLAAYEGRDPKRAGIYAFENKDAAFTPAMLKTFRGNKKAWSFFEAQPPGYKRLMTHWVVSARKDETRTRRLAKLMDESEAGRRIG